MTGPAHGPQHHPCGHVNNSLYCPCTASLPSTTRTQMLADARLLVRDLEGDLARDTTTTEDQ